MADVDMPDAGPSAPAKATASGNKVKPGAGETGTDGRKRFEVKKVGPEGGLLMYISADVIQWNAVALWAWDIVVDNCAICRNHIMDLCDYLRQLSSRNR